MRKRIDIERAFDECVRNMGGECVRDLLPGDPGFENADYLFRDANVVAELKCLEEDPPAKAGFQRKLRDAHARWVSEGKVPPLPNGTSRIESNRLPPECQQEFLSLFQRQFQNSRVKKASRQIKATIDHFRLGDARGLLLIANDGYKAMHPYAAFYFLHHILKGNYGIISNVVYFTANVTATIPDQPDNAFIWADAFVGDREPVPQGLIRSLASHWHRVLQEALGRELRSIRMDSPSADRLEGVRLSCDTLEAGRESRRTPG